MHLVNRLIFQLTLALVLCAFWGHKSFAQPQTFKGGSIVKKIDQILLSGNHTFPEKELIPVLPFTLSDDVKPELVEKAQKTLKEYYEKKGFYLTQVRMQFETKDIRNVIAKISIIEGAPCVVKNFTIADPPQMGTKYSFDRFKAKLRRIGALEAGERYDENILSDRLRELREYLVEQDFVLANTDQVKLTFNEARTEVDVIVEVVYGDRVSFGYQRNTVFTKGELNEFVTQLRSTSLGKDYVGMIERKFKEQYKAKAYNNIEIENEVAEKQNLKHITFYFNEGKRTRIEGIKWEGLNELNVIQADKIFRQSVSRYVQRGYYVDKEIDSGIEIVLEDLKSRGYLNTKLVARSIQPVLKNRTDFDYVQISIQISEGEQTFVGAIKLSGFKYLSDDEIKRMLKLEPNTPFNPFTLEEGLQKLFFRYQSEGFLDFRFTTKDSDIVRFGNSNRFANVELGVDEGDRIKVGEVKILGLDLTQKYVVEREIDVTAEDWWVAENIQGIDTNLKKLGLFSDVRIRPEPSSRGLNYRDLVIELKESQPGAFEAGPGFRSDLGIRAFSRVSYNNFFGKNWIGSLGAEANRRLNNQYRFVEYQIDSIFIEPRFFGTKNLYSAGVSTSKERFPPDFNAVTTKFSTGFERKLFDDYITAKLYYKIERIRQFDVFINGVYSDIDNQTLLIGSLNPSLSYDTRDSPFTTTKGQFSTLALEFADPIFANQSAYSNLATAYTRWTAGTHWYFPITKNIVWSNVAAMGFERSNIEGRPIPLIKLFRLGGYASIRGYREDSINVDTISIKGTLAFLNLRSQFDLPLYGDLKFSPFIDAGNLFVDKFENNPFFRTGAGVGLKYMTPIGPVNLDYGVKLNPRPGDESSQIHFSVGYI